MSRSPAARSRPCPRRHRGALGGALVALELVAAVATAPVTLRLTAGAAAAGAPGAASPFVALYPSVDSPGTDPSSADPGPALAELYAPLLLPSGEQRGPAYQWGSGEVPELAASITHHDGAYTVRLRAGVRACDGSILTAGDVVYSIERAARLAASSASVASDSATAAAYRAAGLIGPGVVPAGSGLTGSVKATGALSVVIRPAHDNGLLPAVLSTPAAAPLDAAALARHAGAPGSLASAWLATHDAGFGPYCLTSYRRGREVLSANPSWHVAPVPALPEIVLEAVASPSKRLQLVRSGAAEVAEQLTPALYQSVATAGGRRPAALVVQDDTTTAHLQLDLNYDLAPWGPNGSPAAMLLRRAVAAALDYPAIRAAALGPAGLPWSGEIPPAIPGALRDAGLFSTDPDLAVADLAEAGYPGGNGLASSGLVLAYDAADPAQQAAAPVIASALSGVGIGVSLDAVPGDLYATTESSYPMSLQSGGETYLDATWYTSRWYAAAATGGTLDTSGYDDPNLNELAVEAGSSSGAGALRLATAEQQIELEDLPMIPLAIEAPRVVVSPRVRGMAVGGIGAFYAVTSLAGATR